MLPEVTVSRINGYVDALVEFDILSEFTQEEITKFVYDYVSSVSPLDTTHEQIVEIVADVLHDEVENVEKHLES